MRREKWETFFEITNIELDPRGNAITPSILNFTGDFVGANTNWRALALARVCMS